MDKELTFYPETERTRDLIYSEHSSCERSIHLLLQDNSVVPYGFLLKVYRETVSGYLSSRRLTLPRAFLTELVSRFEALSADFGVSIDQFKGMGIHLLLRGADAVYLLTSREQDVFFCSDGDILPLTDSCDGGVERVGLVEGDLQKELFPQRFSDLFTVLRFDPAPVGDKDLVLGCGEEERGIILEALSGPIWLESGPVEESKSTRCSTVSKFISKKILAVRLGPLMSQTVEAGHLPEHRVHRRASGVPVRRRFVVGAATVVVAVLIGVLWTGERRTERENAPARVTETTGALQRTEPAASAESAVSGGRTVEAGGLRFSDAWKKTYEEQVTSSPVFFDRWVVFGCRDGNVYALERDTGTLLWKFAAGAGVGASPAVDGERLVIADYSGNVYSLKGTNGTAIWNRKLPMKIVSSPYVSGDRVLVGCYDGYAYCLSTSDGRILWKRKTRGRIRGSSTGGTDAFFVPSYDGYLYALERETGEILWRSNLGGNVAASPAVGENAVVVGAPDGRVCCVDSGGGSTRWTFDTGAAVKSSATISGGNVYVGSNDGHLYCLDIADGSLVWKFKTGDLVLSRAFVQEGVVYVGSYDGSLYALDASTGALLDAFDSGGAIYSSPVTDGEKTYFGTNRGDFFCVTHNGDGTG